MPDQPDDARGDQHHDPASGEGAPGDGAPGEAVPGEAVPGGGAEGERHTGLPDRVERWRRRSATGAIMTGFAFGLQEVFEPERKGPSIVQETSGDPPEDLAVDAEMDPIVARRAVVRIRPWLLERNGAAEDPAASGGAPGAGSPGDRGEPDQPGAPGGER